MAEIHRAEQLVGEVRRTTGRFDLVFLLVMVLFSLFRYIAHPCAAPQLWVVLIGHATRQSQKIIVDTTSGLCYVVRRKDGEGTMSATMKDLKAAIASTGYEIDIDETKPHEMSNEGSICIDIDQELKLQFRDSGGTSRVATYYGDIQGSRAEAIADLVNSIANGFEPMSQDTADACGVDL